MSKPRTLFRAAFQRRFSPQGKSSSCSQNIDDWRAGYIASTVLAGERMLCRRKENELRNPTLVIKQLRFAPAKLATQNKSPKAV
ncbi:hypothetical protein C2U54_04445 [Leclercia sp. LSNIH1]|nr:hypothetical protein C2U54_04445 [Leclercia sp. LSNIH1]POV32433.1 hypothetical protein C3388_21815 [Leclercia sp. LSNIH5]POW62594.1 hypothetical protein C3389_20850 [Leclercia sp. LSNIH2]